MNPSKRYCYSPTVHWNPLVEEYFIKAYGADHFSLISKALTRPSCYSCIHVNTLKTTSDAVIAKLSKILEESGLQNALEEKGMSKNGEAGVSMVEKHRSILEDTSIGQNFDINNNKAFEVSEGLVLFKANGQTCPIFKCQLPGLDYVVFVRGSGPHAIEYDFTQDKPLKEVIVSCKCAVRSSWCSEYMRPGCSYALTVIFPAYVIFANKLGEWLRPGGEDFVQRFDPSSSLDTVGFFIVKFNVGSKDS